MRHWRRARGRLRGERRSGSAAGRARRRRQDIVEERVAVESRARVAVSRWRSATRVSGVAPSGVHDAPESVELRKALRRLDQIVIVRELKVLRARAVKEPMGRGVPHGLAQRRKLDRERRRGFGRGFDVFFMISNMTPTARQ